MQAAITRFSLQHTKWLYTVIWLLVIGTLAQFPRIKIDTDPENMLSSDNSARLFHNATKKTFSLYDSMVVGAVNHGPQGVFNTATLNAIHSLTEQIGQLDGVIVPELISVASIDNIGQGQPGELKFSWMMKSAISDDQQAQQIAANLVRLPLMQDTIVSGDGKAMAIYVPIADKNQSYRIARDIEQAIARIDPNQQNEWHITGLPVAEDRFGYEMFVQMGVAAPMAGAMIFVLMFVFFRNFALILAPMMVAMATVVVTMGLLIGMGFTVHIMSSMIAIFLMPIAVVDSVHLLSEFADRYRPGKDVKQTVAEVTHHLFQPMLFTSITSAVGFLSLLVTPIPPVQIFGVFIAIGIALAFILTITLVPAYISRLSPETLAKLQNIDADNNSRIAQSVRKLGKLAVGYGKFWLLALLAMLVFSVVGISKIQINDNPVRWFKADHPLRVADKVLNQHFAGTYDAFLVLHPADVEAQLAKRDSLLQAADSAWYQSQLSGLNANDNSWLYWQNAIEEQLFNGEDQAKWQALQTELDALYSQSKRFTQPEILAYVSQMQQYLQSTGLVGKSNSLADVVKVVNRELRSGDNADYQIPSTANGVAQALLQYQSSHRPNDLWHFVTPDYQQSLLWLQLTSGDNQDMSKVINLVQDYVQSHPLPAGLQLDWAGKAYLNVVWQEQMVAGMLDSLLSAFAIVFIMMVVLFRSVWFGILAMLPLTFTIAFIYGLIGWIGKDYDMPIAVLSALTLGLSVDFAIHFLERAREQAKRLGSVSAMLADMFEEPGRAITRNALVIALGFTPLLFAPLMPYITVGVFLASIMAASALVTLLMLPALFNMFAKRLFG